MRSSFFIFYFLSIGERSAIKSQPNLVWPEVVSICKCPTKISGALPGAKKPSHFDHFSRDLRTRHRISPERNVASTNQNTSANLQYVPYKLTYTSWPLTQKRLRSVGSPKMKILDMPLWYLRQTKLYKYHSTSRYPGTGPMATGTYRKSGKISATVQDWNMIIADH